MGDFFTQSPANFDTGSVSRHAGGPFPAASTMGPFQPLNLADSLPSRGDSPGGGGFFGNLTGSLTKGADFIGGLFDDFEMPDADTLRAISGLGSAASKLAGGFRAASMHEYNAETKRMEIELLHRSALLEKVRDMRLQKKKNYRNEAIAGGSGLIGYDDIFADDKTSFYYEQSIKQFNNKVFVFGKLRDIEKAAYLAENERLKGIAGASVDVIDTFMDLNPPDGENKKEKLGEG